MSKDADEKLEQLIKDISSVPLPQRDKLIELANRTLQNLPDNIYDRFQSK